MFLKMEKNPSSNKTGEILYNVNDVQRTSCVKKERVIKIHCFSIWFTCEHYILKNTVQKVKQSTYNHRF